MSLPGEDIWRYEVAPRQEGKSITSQEVSRDFDLLVKQAAFDDLVLRTGTQYKETNPKDSCGVKKAPMSTVSAIVMAEVGVAMLEGSRKYGRHNYRVASVLASVYYDAAMRHLMDWWEGTDIDPDSGMSHITKAITSLVVLRDAMLQGKFNDDRPPATIKEGWLSDLNKKSADIIQKYPDGVPAYTNQRNIMSTEQEHKCQMKQ